MLLTGLAMLLSIAGAQPSAQLPQFYTHPSRVTWVVKDIRRPVDVWKNLGLTDVHAYGNVRLSGSYLGQSQAIHAQAVSGRIGNLAVDMLQPERGSNAFTHFLSAHGDGIFAMVYQVPSAADMAGEISRMSGLGVKVLQQMTIHTPKGTATYTYFDTEPKGKYVLGLVCGSEVEPFAAKEPFVSHLAIVIRHPEEVSAFWQKLGFPGLEIEHATPREDSRYRGKPLWLSFDVGWQRLSQFTLEWIIPPSVPQNVYVDFLGIHGEGIQHIGMLVGDLQQTVDHYTKLGYPARQSGAWGEVGQKNSGQYDYMDTELIGGVNAEVIHQY
jgi:catechol 2,3-dioxygenase-like lactoylglutathione lyase family enzyme